MKLSQNSEELRRAIWYKNMIDKGSCYEQAVRLTYTKAPTKNENMRNYSVPGTACPTRSQ